MVYRGQRQTYYGRGYVQLTWLVNYARMSTLLTLEFGKEIDLVSNPELAVEYSIPIIWEGMIRGTFTGKNFADYIKPGSVDYVNARRIINGTDKAQEIADIARQFENALKFWEDETPEASPCPLNRSECPLTQEATT